MALVSGLGVGGEAGEPLGLSLLVDWITGVAGSPQDQALAAQVCPYTRVSKDPPLQPMQHRSDIDVIDTEASPIWHTLSRAPWNYQSHYLRLSLPSMLPPPLPLIGSHAHRSTLHM